MAFWTESFMNKMRTEWLRRIARIQYLAGGTWYDAQITDKVTTQTTDSVDTTITSVRILDTSGDVAGQISESIRKTAGQGVITLWEFPLYEIIT